MIDVVCSGGVRSRSWIVALATAVGSVASAAPLAAQGNSAASPRVHGAASPAGARTIEMVRIPSGIGTLRIALHHLRPSGGRPAAPGHVVLLIHGASFPTLLADGYRFRGRSWMDDLADAGYDVWAMDWLGYGASDRYPEMEQPAGAHPPLGRAPVAARQLDAVVRYITGRTHVPRVSLVAHSAGTLATGLYATEHPERVERLVLFGPVTLHHEPRDTSALGAYTFVTEDDQRNRFRGYIPSGEAQVFDGDMDAWASRYMDTDSTSRSRAPASVKIPMGMIADLTDAESGTFPYDPARITAPVLIVRGEWDTVTTDAGARWLFDALTRSPLKRDVKISRGTHIMHLETARTQLYAEVRAFLAGGDLPSPVSERAGRP
ncbi:MAG TPA: alpha/beta fold hydrolase [Gemmatimonadaceae bacterium]